MTKASNPKAPSPQGGAKPGSPLKRWLRRGVEAALFVALLYGITQWQSRGMLASGRPAPEFALTSLSGQTYRLEDLRGRRVVVHFWATWCPVCKNNIPLFNLIAPYYQKDPIFLAVAVDGQNRHKVAAVAEDKGITYPVLLGSPKIGRQYRVSKYPSTYFINEQGRITAQDSGFLTPLGLWWKAF
jgi:peroxiredoxin